MKRFTKSPVRIIVAIPILVLAYTVAWGPRGYVIRSNISGLGWTRANILRRSFSPSQSKSIALIRIAVPQDGPVYECAAFSRWFPLPILETTIYSPPMPSPREAQDMSARRFTAEWLGVDTALVKIDEWTVAYFDIANGRTAIADVDLGLKTRNIGLWVERWEAESKRLESLAVRIEPPNQAL